MDEILASVELGPSRSMHIGSLSKRTIVDAGADHMGFEGYFLFEADDAPNTGITVLGKVASLEAAFRMLEIWRYRPA